MLTVQDILVSVFAHLKAGGHTKAAKSLRKTADLDKDASASQTLKEVVLLKTHALTAPLFDKQSSTVQDILVSVYAHLKADYSKAAKSLRKTADLDKDASASQTLKEFTLLKTHTLTAPLFQAQPSLKRKRGDSETEAAAAAPVAKKSKQEELAALEANPDKLDKKALKLKIKALKSDIKAEAKQQKKNDKEKAKAAAAKKAADDEERERKERAAAEAQRAAAEAAAKAAAAKKAAEEAAMEASDSSDSSDSDSDDDEDEADAAVAAVAVAPAAASSSSSSDSDSDSDSDDDGGVGEALRMILAAKKAAPAPEIVDEGTPKSKGKGKHQPNRPFRRVQEEDYDDLLAKENDLLKNNQYGVHSKSETYGARANKDFSKTRGKSFRREMTKKKRGGYRGGEVDEHSLNAIPLTEFD